MIQEPPPPPPKRYVLPSPDLPPLPPLPPEATIEERHPLMSPLDVSSLQSSAAVPLGLVMDSPHEVIGASSTVNKSEQPLYTISSSGQRTIRTGNASSTSSNNEAPPSEISV